MDGQRKSKKIMYFKNFSNTIQYFLLVVSRPLRRVFKTFSWKSSKKNKIFMIFFKFRTIFFQRFFRFFSPFFLFPTAFSSPPFFATNFLKLVKWKIFRFIGNFSTSENFPIHLILLEKFPPSQFDLKIGTLKGPDIKWKIFRFIGNFSTSENFPIHLILVEKFPPSQFDLKIGTPQAMCTSGVPR